MLFTNKSLIQKIPNGAKNPQTVRPKQAPEARAIAPMGAKLKGCGKRRVTAATTNNNINMRYFLFMIKSTIFRLIKKRHCLCNALK